MQIAGGAAEFAPLDQLTLIGLQPGILIVRDGSFREVLRVPVSGAEATITLGGRVGWQQIALEAGGQVIDQVVIRVRASTWLEDADGFYRELLDMLRWTMEAQADSNSCNPTFARFNGRIYFFLVGWLRDHVHTLKGMKYFTGRLRDGIDLYRDSQRADGMIWDNVNALDGKNYWDVRFRDGDFTRVIDDGLGEFHRIPVEADVEYLFVEGLYYTWKATGDDAWMAESLDAARRALEYCVSSPYRWSEKFGLIKRGYTIDTWDFQNEEDSVVSGDPMRIDPDRTRFGVMFGDNTGYIAACRTLAEMLDHAGRHGEAEIYRQRADQMQTRLDQVSWNGRFFTHHVPEQAGLIRDLGVDESTQLSLSNAYSLNRGISAEQAANIVRAYQQVRDQLPAGSPGEWYTIYPPFERGYGGHNARWQYMNAGVTPIVAGELARGAFEHGFEAYGVDILRRIEALARTHGRQLHAVYTGAFPEPPTRSFTPLDLSAVANADTHGTGAPGVPGWTGAGDNDLHALPTGEQILADIPFLLADPAANGRRGCIGLSTRPGGAEQGYLAQVIIPVGQSAASIYFLHGVSQPGVITGLIMLHYADGDRHSQVVAAGVNVSNWWYPQAGGDSMRVAWIGENAHANAVGLVACGLNNPRPEAVIESIVLSAAIDCEFWGVCAVTLCDQPVYFRPSPISYGIPNNWAAAAVVYALVEGLAGVIDAGTTFERVRLCPRWSAADVNEVRAIVHYPDSDGYCAYAYRHLADQRRFEITLTGSGSHADIHLLLPSVVESAARVQVDGRDAPFAVSRIGDSRYVDFAVALPGVVAITVDYV
jgi:hypothetical protein